MTLKDAFQSLENLYEESEYINRQNIINKIKMAGYTCNFDRFSTRQLAAMLPGIVAKAEAQQASELKNNTGMLRCCDDCGTQLSDNGTCPKCDEYGLGDAFD